MLDLKDLSAYYNVDENWLQDSYERYCGRGEYTPEEWRKEVEERVLARDRQGIRQMTESMRSADFLDKELFQRIVED